MKDILVINSGSSSIKFALYQHEPAGNERGFDGLCLRYQGHLSGIGSGRPPGLSLKDERGETIDAPRGLVSQKRLDHHGAIDGLIGWVERQGLANLSAVGHRIVHGGRSYHTPMVLDAEVIRDLEAFIPLAPLHQPYGLEPAKRLAELRPGLPQVACFDTAFHTTQPRVAREFALPRELTDKGLIRYGFHGLSYDYINRVLPDHLAGAPGERVIVAHLGNGASMCAIKDGRSITSTMGFTAVEGLTMGTRCGSLDPGLVLHLIDQEGMNTQQVSELLYKRSGLLGMSGISSDMRELLESPTPEARDAIALFVHRIVREIGSLAAAMGGLDQLVFTAGIGERAVAVRQAVGEQSRWLGIELDDQANACNATKVSSEASRVGVWVIPTDEERMIAWYTANHLQQSASA
ncbi:acetate/propionate family kinase [Halomonas sp. Bachu 37]|uniref:acetate/propionate family kinase n=1 Tax=Halomonas kashgarensis TaxID=3084920 RepID=UPI003216A052